jgi:hypothetical protein
LPTNGSSSGAHSTSENKEKVGFVVNATEKNELKELRSHVDGLSNEVQVAVGDLKKSIADIRSSVCEMENPFNLLRTPSDEARLPPGAKSLMIGGADEETTDKAQQKPELSIPQIEAPPEKPITAQPLPKAKTIKPTAYLDWVWDLLDSGLTAENIQQLANMGEMTGYLPKQSKEFIYSLAITAEKIREIGYTKAHLMLFLYKAAAVSKTTVDSEDLQSLIDITEEQLKNAKEE